MRCPVSTSRSIGQALALDAFDGQVGASNVINAQLDPVGIPKVEFAQIPVQMGFADMLVNTIDAALQDGEVAFEGVGVGVVPNVFLGGMVDGLAE